MKNGRRLIRINRKNQESKPKKKVDKQLLFLALGLTLAGLVAVADASSPQALRDFNDPYYFIKQQAMWAGIGLMGLVFGSIVNYGFWKRYAYYIFGVSVILLVVVLIPGIGTKIYGARRWIITPIGGFQPAEVVKLTIAILLAAMVDEERPYWHSLVVIGLVGGLIMLQPDFGTTMAVTAIGTIQIFVSGLPILWMIGLGVLGSGLSSLIVLTSDYRRERLMTFLQSSSDPLGSSYHIRQILIALGSGGLLGVGLGKSRQKHLFLPETATDSVFAVIAEEVGFIGASLIVIALFYLIIRAYRIALAAPDKFSKIFAVGVASWIGMQTILNLASMVALTPLTGIPLPFFSYGGTSLTMILFSVGILLNISKHEV